jgi:hypothetical protein
MAPGGAELGTPGAADDRADEDVVVAPLSAPCEHPVTANNPVATTAAHRSRGWSRYRHTVSNYATLSGVTELFGFCECCRP